MANQQTLQGQWTQLKGKIKEKWGQLTDDDLQSFSGNTDQLVGAIQQRTGESRQAIEDFLERITSGDAAAAVGRVGEKARRYAHDAGAAAQQFSGQMAEMARQRYSEAGRLVQDNPGSSVLTALGVGLVTGLLLGVMLKSR